MVQKTTLPKKVKKSVKDYINLLKKDKLTIDKVVVFGSQTKQTSHRDSDIDICIISPKFKDYFNDLHYLLMKSYEIDAVIEPHPYHPKDFIDEDPLVWEIKKHGARVR